MKLWDKTLKKMYYRRVPYKMQDWGFRLGEKEKKQRKKYKSTKVQEKNDAKTNISLPITP